MKNSIKPWWHLTAARLLILLVSIMAGLSFTSLINRLTVTTPPPKIAKQQLSNDLINATISGDQKRVWQLIAEGADINCADRDGWTPLMWAAGQNDVEMIKILLAAHPCVNQRDNYGYTALVWGAKNDQIAMLLLNAGADPNISGNNGQTIEDLKRYQSDYSPA